MKNAVVTMDELQKAVKLVEERFPGTMSMPLAIAFLSLSVRWLYLRTRDRGKLRKFVEGTMAAAMEERIILPTPDEVAKLAGYEE